MMTAGNPFSAAAAASSGSRMGSVVWEAIEQQMRVEIPSTADPRLASTSQMRAKLFKNLAHEKQLALFLASLPTALRDAPKIDWRRLPARALFSMLWGKASTSPERNAIALAAGVMPLDGIHGADLHQVTYAPELVRAELQALFGIEELRQMNYERWVAFGGQTEVMRRLVKTLVRYSSMTATHVRSYLEGLTVEERGVLDGFRLPELPARFLECW